MNTRNKKNIGILLAAIMVTSIFVGLAPTVFSGWVPDPYTPYNVTIDTPVQDSCVRGIVNITWTPQLTGTTWVARLGCADGCIEYPVIYHGACPPIHPCANAEWDTSGLVCENVCIGVWNASEFYWDNASVWARNYTNFTVDNVNPCIEPESPTAGDWYNCTSAIELNVSACDNCCGLKNVTANISVISDEDVVEFTPTGKSAGKICEGADEQCVGEYYSYSVTTTHLETSCGIRNITVTARDNATDKDGNSNTATTTLTLGVDCEPPEQVDDEDCEELTGAIWITWDEADDDCSGVDYYEIYGKHLNASTGEVCDVHKDWNIDDEFKVGETADLETFFTGAHDDALYCNWYQFKIRAVDNAGNIGEFSDWTEPQHLIAGTPEDIDLVVPDELVGCGTKHNGVIDATVKDEFGVGVPDIAVCYNTTDGQVCPTEETTDDCGEADVDYTTPEVVFMPYNVTICAWVCNNESIVECKNILIVPKQAVDATITAVPDMIMAGEGENNESLIVVELVDVNGNPVGGSGNQDVCVFTDAGTFKSTGTAMVCGKMELGMFFATLVSGDTPTLATVSADVGALYFPSTTVAFAGWGSYDIPLCKGWNLISLPLVPDNNNADAVLSGIAGDLLVAYAYDGWTGNWTYGLFTPGPTPGPWIGTLDTMNVLRGYWLEMNTSATLMVTGYTMVPGPLLPPTLYVPPGWNLVGYYAIPPDKVMTAEDYFTEVTVSYNVLGYDCESQGYFSVGPNDNLESGKGYWMNAETYGEITPQEWL
jgi:hypothetical protein